MIQIVWHKWQGRELNAIRSYKGNKDDPSLLIALQYEEAISNVSRGASGLTGRILMKFINPDIHNNQRIKIVNNVYYCFEPITKEIPNVNETPATIISLDASPSAGWYDFTVFSEDNHFFEKRFEGRIETGSESSGDPAFG